MSTRSTIWLGESEGRHVHIYWEIGERDSGDGKSMRAPIYIAIDSGDQEQEVVIRLPKDIAIRLLMGLSLKWADQVAQVI